MQLFNSAPDPMLLIDQNGRIVLANKRAGVVFGYDSDEMLNLTVEDLIPMRLRSRHIRQRSQTTTAEAAQSMGGWRSLQALNRSGCEIPVDISLSEVTYATGTFTLACIRDMTERRWMESVLQGHSVTLERIATGAPLGEVVEAVASLIEQSSPLVQCAVLLRVALERSLQIVGETTLAESVRSALQCDGAKLAESAWHQAIFDGERFSIIDADSNNLMASIRDLFREGRIRACWSEPVRGSAGEILGAVVVCASEARLPLPREAEQLSRAAHLVSIAMERDHQAKQLELQEDQLRQKQKLEAVGALASGISHEFNNLLQVIAAYTDFARKATSPDDPRYADLERIRSATQGAISLTRQLLTFCRMQPAERKIVNVGELVSETVKMIAPLLGDEVKVEQSMPQNLLYVRGDFSQLQQVLVNLCINARDAMEERGTIRISVSQSDEATSCERDSFESSAIAGNVLLQISDSGCGMNAQVRSRIFEPFYTTKEPGKGTGLGLSMLLGIVQIHDGQIEVESEVGVGSTFRITLPAVVPNR